MSVVTVGTTRWVNIEVFQNSIKLQKKVRELRVFRIKRIPEVQSTDSVTNTTCACLRFLD